MGSLTFRRAVSADLAALVALLAADPIASERESARMPLDPRYAEAFSAIDRDPNQLLGVADRGGQVIGFLQLSFIPGLTRRGMWRGHIEGVRVAVAARRDGIGRAMLQWAVEECRKRGCGMVQLTSDKRRYGAHGFYEALGFRATHEGYKLSL